jgi:hypothetical protein
MHYILHITLNIVQNIVEFVCVLLGFSAFDISDLQKFAALGLEHSQMLGFDLVEDLNHAVVEFLYELLLL